MLIVNRKYNNIDIFMLQKLANIRDCLRLSSRNYILHITFQLKMSPKSKFNICERKLIDYTVQPYSLLHILKNTHNILNTLYFHKLRDLVK